MSVKTKRIYDWSKHCYITVVVQDANSFGCYVAPRHGRPRGPLSLTQRIHRYLARYGPQTAKHLATVLLGSGENRHLARICIWLNADGRFMVIGHKKMTGGKRKLWGIKNAEVDR